MTIIEIEQKMEEIGASVSTQRRFLKNAKTNLTNAASVLGNIPTVYAETLAAINALGSTTYEAVLKARRTAYAAEFAALRAEAEAAVTALAAITFEG